MERLVFAFRHNKCQGQLMSSDEAFMSVLCFRTSLNHLVIYIWILCHALLSIALFDARFSALLKDCLKVRESMKCEGPSRSSHSGESVSYCLSMWCCSTLLGCWKIGSIPRSFRELAELWGPANSDHFHWKHLWHWKEGGPMMFLASKSCEHVLPRLKADARRLQHCCTFKSPCHHHLFSV